MSQTLAMDDEDPKNVVPLFKLGARVNRHKDHPLVKGAPGDLARKHIAQALDAQTAREKEAADDAAEAAQRGFFGKAYHSGVTFLFGAVPTALNNVLSRLARKSQKGRSSK